MSLCTTDAWIVCGGVPLGTVLWRRACSIGDVGDGGESFESKELDEIERTMHGEKTVCGHGHEGKETKKKGM